jgi:peptidoglycan/LPS O-acetylase OafA/YrhL
MRPNANTGHAGAIPHRPALDGLRGLAVLSVVAFHANAALRGGYLGVDLFFVLSGYLITSILVAEHEAKGRIDLRRFWVRRARRLLPALLALMPAIALYAKVWATPIEIASLRADALATLAYVANWRAILANKSYWEIFASPSPLEHTWSLAIEEQFYVVWPLLVVVVLRQRRPRRALFAVSLGLALVSAILMLVWWTPERTSRVYMGSDTRAAAILVGAALATVLRPDARLPLRAVRVLDGAGCVAALGLAFAYATLAGESPRLYHGGFWLTELAAIVLIACAVSGEASLIGRLLSFRPLAWVGTISYGVYLWHWPVDVVLTVERIHVRSPLLDLLRLVVTFAIALASYRWIERPIRSRGISFAPPAVVVPATFMAVLALVIWTTKPRSQPVGAKLLTAVSHGPGEPMRWPDGHATELHLLPPASELPPDALRILVIGDSVAQYLGNEMRFAQESAQAVVGQRGVGACTIRPAEVRYVNGERIEGTCCADAWEKDVGELRPDATLIVLGGGYLGPKTCEREWRKTYNERLTFLIRQMGENAGRVIIALVPYPGQRWRTSNMVQLVDCFNEELKQVADAEHKDVIDLKTHVCPNTDCEPLESNGHPIRRDGLHFDGAGAVETARWTLGEVRRLVGPLGRLSQAPRDASLD